MANITLQFGKYKGKSFENIVSFDREYLVWLAKADISRQNASKEALDFLGGKAQSFKASIASDDEIKALEEQRRRDREEQPEKLCWSVPVPGCSASRFIEIWVDDGEFCVMINSQFSSYPLNAIQSCEVPGSPEIVARIGNVGLTAEHHDALLSLAR